jgi:hypothetical protein
MTTPNMPSPLTLNDPRVNREFVLSSAQPASSPLTAPGISGYKSWRLKSQSTSLSTVDEEDTMPMEAKPVETALKTKVAESGSYDSSVKSNSEASYKDNHDPFANEGDRGMHYKVLTLWYVMILQTRSRTSD